MTPSLRQRNLRIKRAVAADSESEGESSCSDSSGETEGGPIFTSTRKKETRKVRRKDRDSGISLVWAKRMCKTLEQKARTPGGGGQVHRDPAQ